MRRSLVILGLMVWFLMLNSSGGGTWSAADDQSRGDDLVVTGMAQPFLLID